MNENFFYENLKDTMESLSSDPFMEEYENFLVNGEELNIEAQLMREKSRILLNFSHLKGQEFDFVKYNDFRKLINILSDTIDNYRCDVDTLKKIIVHIDLELGIEVFFTGAFAEMVEVGIEEITSYEHTENFSFETLYQKYNKGLSYNI